jgi:sigma-B regulation protein RsbU (phosphoserine phosphatase)
MLLGRKAEGDDYTHHEMDLLRSLASQIGMAAENLQLLGDRLERQRLEDQLSVARRIQEGLLPATLDVPGCEVAARIRFCLEVAGDFYDCVPLRDGRVLLAIGDVAGKGVGAALLMANVQASLRAIKNTGISLTDTAAEINAIVHQNTPPHLFITLFVGIYDPRSRHLTCVNAGHNPPLLRSANGQVQHLSVGGLLLGVREETEYQQEAVLLHPGDLVVMYTDGVTEARDALGDQFGVERLAGMLPLFARLSLDEALDRLEDEVRRFTGRPDMEDDFTLLVLRVPGEGV